MLLMLESFFLNKGSNQAFGLLNFILRYLCVLVDVVTLSNVGPIVSTLQKAKDELSPTMSSPVCEA